MDDSVLNVWICRECGHSNWSGSGVCHCCRGAEVAPVAAMSLAAIEVAATAAPPARPAKPQALHRRYGIPGIHRTRH